MLSSLLLLKIRDIKGHSGTCLRDAAAVYPCSLEFTIPISHVCLFGIGVEEKGHRDPKEILREIEEGKGKLLEELLKIKKLLG